MQEGTGSGDITQKVGEGDGRETEREREWEYSVCLCTWHGIYCVSTIWMDVWVDGWMDGQWTLQLMRGSDCYSRFVSCSQTQGATRMRTAEPPSQGWRRRGWRWWWWHSQSARRPGKKKEKENAAARRGGCFGALRQQEAWVRAGAGAGAEAEAGARAGEWGLLCDSTSVQYRTCPARCLQYVLLLLPWGPSTVDRRLRYNYLSRYLGMVR